MGWGYGYVTAAALDVARFYWALLGPPHSIVTKASVAEMETWDAISQGWGKNLKYGAGLELEFASHVSEFKNFTRPLPQPSLTQTRTLS